MLTNLIKAILLTSVLCSSVSALEMIKHKSVNDGTNTTIVFNGERVEN